MSLSRSAKTAVRQAESEEAMRQAEAKGLTLLRSESSSSYRGVVFNRSSTSSPFAS